jgi:hypothetical protein
MINFEVEIKGSDGAIPTEEAEALAGEMGRRGFIFGFASASLLVLVLLVGVLIVRGLIG